MGQFSKVLLAIDNAHTVPQRAHDCRPGLYGLRWLNKEWEFGYDVGNI